MTAEVGVLNKMGVALAADSAVSIGPDADKIYSSADKLFNLTESAPVGIMINGSADFLGVPWETIIKSYRKERRGKKFGKLNEYLQDFLEYVASNRRMFPAQLQKSYVGALVISYLEFVRDKVKDKLDRIAEERDGLEESDIPPIVHEAIEEEWRNVQTKAPLVGFDKEAIEVIRKQYSSLVTKNLKEVFGDLPMESLSNRLLSRLVIEVLTRDYMSPFVSGVVVAGFGEDEHMPSLYSVNVEIMVNNRIRCVQTHESVITHEITAAIVPFAQQEMVHAFLKGIDPDIEASIRLTSKNLFHGIVDLILSEVEKNDAEFGSLLRKTVAHSIDDVLKSVHADWDELCRKHWLPIMTIASALPKDELGSLAEALVNLTKFRRRVSEDRETVGGPIDVAVITKGDGFVWVNRKHYFDPTLNPRIIASYVNRV